MRRVQVWSDSRRIARSVTASANQNGYMLAGKAEQATQSMAWGEGNLASGGLDTVPAEKLQEVLWKQFFADTAEWWDYRCHKPAPQHPDFRHKECKVPLWLNNRHKPHWVDSQLAMLDASLRTGVTLAEGPVGVPAAEGRLDAEMPRKVCVDGLVSDAVDALHLLVYRGYHVPRNLFHFVLKRCIHNKDLSLGRRIHALVLKIGYQGDAFLATQLIGLYASQGRLKEAMLVFSKVSRPNAYNWATIIFAYARHGEAVEAAEAVRLYRQMCESTTIRPDDCLYSAILKACATAKDLITGKEVHSRILASSAKPNRLVQDRLVNMYAKCGSLEDARKLFDKFSDRNVVTWSAMIAGYAQQGMGHEALSLYGRMQQEGLTANSVTYVSLLQACASIGASALQDGKQLHTQIKERGLEEDSIVGGSLVNMYAKCGSLQDARRFLDKLPEKSIVSWTAMIAAYAQQGMGQEALTLYSSMRLEGLTANSVTYVSLLQACASVGMAARHEGKQLSAEIRRDGLEEDMVIGGSLVNMLAKCSYLEDARSLFDRLSRKSIVAWTSMIAGYVHHGLGQEALDLYCIMLGENLVPDPVAYLCLLQACASLGALHEGKQLHARIQEQGMEENVALGGGLVNMYAKCGSLEDARSVFDKLPERNIVAWNSMIAGYAQQGLCQEALNLHSCMQRENLIPDPVTYVCLLQACAALAALPLGQQLHAEIEVTGLQADENVGAALVSMYAKCGSIYDSQRVFDTLSERSTEAWGALISGYAHQGDSQVVFDLVDRMVLEGIQPSKITFLSVLTVCSHGGLVDKGREYFEVMTTDYGISACIEHYICMVDLLGGAGHLQEALQMAKTMPFPANEALWHALLGACRKWKSVEIGQLAFNGAVALDHKDAAAYVLMSNIYSSTQMWQAAKEIHARRLNLGARKKPGQSWWTDSEGVVHTFLVGDKQHPESEGIYARLDHLISKLSKDGYMPHLESSLMDASDEMKEAALRGHSEKLAIAYALNKTAEGSTIRIVKNLRVCEDCHIATAYISKVEKRTIVCRDASRFHVFKEGHCSCGDYW